MEVEIHVILRHKRASANAEVLKVSEETVMRDWKLAKVWLLRDLSGGKHHGA
jgi:hypothetical protein